MCYRPDFDVLCFVADYNIEGICKQLDKNK